MGKYNKLVGQFLFTVVGFVAASLGGGISISEWVNTAILASGAASVLYADNTPAAPYIKAFVSFVSAGLVVLQSALTDGGVSTGEWYMIAAAALATLSVYGLENKQGRIG